MVQKEIKRGQYSLKHHIIKGAGGLPQNLFELIRTDEKGFRTLLPFHEPAKVSNLDRNDYFKLDTYTDEE